MCEARKGVAWEEEDRIGVWEGGRQGLREEGKKVGIVRGSKSVGRKDVSEYEPSFTPLRKITPR